uniref:Large ribosomal subunit protein uL24c n=1 Tax=Gelidium elegans TaxID=37200 RepID=A0A141SDT6_GELEL|nr:ribosomal protein L24 [Gelidium elegans]AMK96454.1 ribosomal protein L24 [Gelidium elegans]
MQKIKKKYGKIHVHKGDKVKIISGKYAGEIGNIKNIIYKKNTIIVENLNTATKHVKPKKEGENGEIILIEKPIHSSNVIKYNENKVN